MFLLTAFRRDQSTIPQICLLPLHDALPILKFSKDPNINKRRASLVLFCSPLARVKDDDLADAALKIVERLKSEKDVLIRSVEHTSELQSPCILVCRLLLEYKIDILLFKFSH